MGDYTVLNEKGERCKVFVVADDVGAGHPYLTAGKEYEVVGSTANECALIVDDQGDEIAVRIGEDPRINGLAWRHILRPLPTAPDPAMRAFVSDYVLARVRSGYPADENTIAYAAELWREINKVCATPAGEVRT